jgi:hypothetical protein
VERGGGEVMESWEYMDNDEVWEAIWDALQLQPLNELEIYRRWIPRFNQRFQKLRKLEAELAKCQGNLQAMSEDYITEGQQLRDDLTDLRILLWSTHPCQGKYGDDGELQCSKCMIDFKRDPIERIEERIMMEGLKQYNEYKTLRKAAGVAVERLRCHTVLGIGTQDRLEIIDRYISAINTMLGTASDLEKARKEGGG